MKLVIVALLALVNLSFGYNASYVAACTARQRQREAVMVNAINTLYSGVAPPASTRVWAGLNSPPQIFASTFKGRIIPFDFELNKTQMEDFFFKLGFMGTTTYNGTNLPTPLHYGRGPIRGLTINGTIAQGTHYFAMRVGHGSVYEPENFFLDGHVTAYIPEHFTFRFDCDGKILYAEMGDADLLTLQDKYANRTAPVQASIAAQVCAFHALNCTGSNSQFLTSLDCLAYMNSIPLGDRNTYGYEDSLQCRGFNAIRALVLGPQYCVEVGPNSNECRNRKLPDFFDETGFLGLQSQVDYFGNQPITFEDPSSCAQDWYDCQHAIDAYAATL